MPCNDGGVPYPPSEKEQLDAHTPAMLCAVLRCFDDQALDNLLKEVDWDEAGVTRTEFSRWWRLHREQDQARREDEERRAKRAAALKSARAKLNRAEREALGLIEDDTHDEG